MFANAIREGSTPFTSKIADEMFGHITGRPYRGDESFTATMRALLHKRLPDGAHVSVRQVDFPLNLSDSVFNAEPNAFLSNAIDGIPADTISVASVRGTQEYINRVFSALDEKMDRVEDISIRRDLQQVFEKAKTAARFYINAATNSALIVIERLDLTRWRLIQCSMKHYLPNYFSGENDTTPAERDMLRSLHLGSSDDYLAAISKLAEGIDFRGYVLEHIVKDLSKSIHQSSVTRTENKLRELRARLEELISTQRSVLNSIDTENVMLLGFRERLRNNDGDKELLEFMKMNKNIEPLERHDHGFSIIIRTDLDSYDPDLYERMARNADSDLYYDYEVENDDFDSDANKRKLLDAIFGENPVLKVNTCAYFDIDVRGSVHVSSGYSFPAAYDDCLPNPHLDHHACLGQHRAPIESFIQRGDIPAALMQCRTAASSINLGEQPTLHPFLRDLFGTTNKIIRLPDGTNVNPSEALKWLNN